MSIKAKLNTFDATMIVVSLVIGIGIFRTPAIVASSTESAALFFAAWILGGVISFLGALTFAEVGARFTHPGAYYSVVAECYHPALAFMLNWTNVVVVNGAGAAAVAIIGAEYLVPILLPAAMQSQLTVQAVATVLTLFLITINYLGIKTGAWAQNILTLIKIGMILMLAFVAFQYGNSNPTAAISTGVSRPWWIALGIGLISVFYTYGGYQIALNFGADIKNAQKNMPRAIFFGIVIIIALYLVINAAYFRVLGLDGIAGAKLVAAEVARVCFGRSAYLIVSIAIFLSAMGFVNVTLMQIPRTYYAMAEKGALPAVFMKVNEKTQTQEFTLLFFGAMIVLSIFLLGTFEKIVNYVMFFDCLNNALVASTIFVLRRRARNGPEHLGYRVPFYPVLPALFVGFLVMIAVNVILTQPNSTYYGLAILALGYPVYLLLHRFSTKDKGPSDGR